MRGDQRTDMSLMAFGGRTNAVLELGKRLIQPEEEWKDKCAAFTELRSLLSDFSLLQSKMKDGPENEEAVEDGAVLFAPENVQALTQPFRVTVTDLRSTVVKESCATLSLLAQVLGPVRCKILVRDVFPTLLEARGGSNRVNTAAIHSCVEAIVDATPSRFVLAPVLQVLKTSKNRDMRESCIHYIFMALEGWSSAVLERFRIPLQSAIAVSLSDASPKGREKARDCYWKYAAIWPDEVNRMNTTLSDGVKKHLKRSRKEAGLDSSVQATKRRHLATITNTVSSISAAKNLFDGEDTSHTNKSLDKRVISNPRLQDWRASGDKKSMPSPHTPLLATAAPVPLSRIPATPTSALKKPREGKDPSKIPTPPHVTRTRKTESTNASPAYLKTKYTEIQEENAALTKTLEAQTNKLEQLREQIQMMKEEKQVTESQHKEVIAATMAVHAADTATQQEIQYQLAEQVASQENEIDELRSQSSPSSSPIQPHQHQAERMESEVTSLSEQLQAATAKLDASNAAAGDEMSGLQREKAALEERLAAQSAQLEEFKAQQRAAMAALEEEKRVLSSEVSALKSIESDTVAQCREQESRDPLSSSAAIRGGCCSNASEGTKPTPLVPLRAFSLAFTHDRSEVEEEQRRINDANLLKRRLRRQNRQRQP